ncbi:hypothetical protein HA466_0314340 [Hirschfeldia incana]|nr:hypothetical protein HA466_0314340 [Hirschfeldia incana]
MFDWLVTCFYGTREEQTRATVEELEGLITAQRDIEVEHMGLITTATADIRRTNEVALKERLRLNIAMSRTELEYVRASIRVLQGEVNSIRNNSRSSRNVLRALKISTSAKRRLHI